MIYHLTMSSYDEHFKELSDDDWLSLRTHVPSLALDKASHRSWESFFVDVDGMREIARLKLTVSFSEGTSDGGLMFVKLQDRIRALELRSDDTAGQVLSGGGVHVHVPDLALMSVREVCHLDDCCTDSLQRYLDDGWRILAFCPPNAQRRPDYILGRSKGEK